MPETKREDVLVKEVSAAHTGQFALLKQRRFAPFFATQFLGAANDNLFKFALTVLVTYQLQVSWLPPQMAGLVIGALFILPFLLMSATAGQWADKHDKATIMRHTKLMEVVIMAIAVVGLIGQMVPLLLVCIFLMGLQSTLFGPVKYAYLPQHLSERELTGGNGLVEMGTFVAILLGNVAGGLLMSIPQLGVQWVAGACLGVALLGWLASMRIPTSPASDPGLKLNWNPFSETWRNLQLARQYPSVFRSLLGISWMWFFGAVFLSQFPSFARDVLGGNEQVASLLLVVFSVGIAVGSLAVRDLLAPPRRDRSGAHRCAGHDGVCVRPVPGLAGGGAPGVGGACCRWASSSAQPAHWRVMADLALLAFSAGFYSVPMYALIQLRAQPSHRARIIAANNILNALFMVVSSLLAGGMLGAGFEHPAGVRRDGPAQHRGGGLMRSG